MNLMNLIDIESSNTIHAIGFRFWCVWTTRWGQSHISSCSSVVYLESQSHIIHDISHIHSYLTNTHSGSYPYVYIYKRRKFRSQTSDNMDRWKAEMGRVREEKRRRKIKENKNQKKEDLGARKGRTVAIHCVFPVICGSGGSKSKLGAMWPDERWKVARRCGAKHIRSAIRDSQQPSFPIGFLFWNFRHRLVRHYR